MIRGLVSGRLHKLAEAKTSAAGKGYVVATLVMDAVADGGSRFARVVAFGEAAERLLNVGKGEAVAVAGKIEVSVWTPEGREPEAQIRVLADEVAAVGSRAVLDGSTHTGGRSRAPAPSCAVGASSPTER